MCELHMPNPKSTQQRFCCCNNSTQNQPNDVDEIKSTRHRRSKSRRTRSNRFSAVDGAALQPRRCQPMMQQPTSRRQHHNVRLSPNSPATSLLPPDPPKPARLPPPCIRPLHHRHSRINLGVNLRVVRRGIIRKEEAN